MAAPKYRITKVEGGFFTVEWTSAGGMKVAYPVPLDDEGDPLSGSDLEAWLATQWVKDIAPRAAAGRSASGPAVTPKGETVTISDAAVRNVPEDE